MFNSPVDVSAARARAHALFQVMESHLAARDFLLGSALTLADVANYAYVARAPEGGVSLQEYPRIRAWLARVEATPGFVPMAEAQLPA